MVLSRFGWLFRIVETYEIFTGFQYVLAAQIGYFGNNLLSVQVSSYDGSSWTSRYFEDQRADQTGFTPVGTNAAGSAGAIWYGTAIADIDLIKLGLGLNDQVKIDLFVRDCGLGGHGGLVFLDGFGTTQPADPVSEPATMLLLGTGLMGLSGFGRKKFFKKS